MDADDVEPEVTSELLLPELFRRVAAEHPRLTAVDRPPGSRHAERTTWTYAELSARAESVAAALDGMAGRDRIVAVALDRGEPEVYAAQLGILFAGAAWVCVDVEHPDERLAEIFDDARPVAVITSSRHARRMEALAPEEATVLPVEDIPTDGARPTPSPRVRGDDLAYVIYTSGTTGRPKGVMIEHRSIANLVHSDVARFDIAPGDRVVQNSSPVYDSSVEETWLAFAFGATLVIMDGDVARSGPDVVPWLAKERIAVFCPPPTLLRSAGSVDPRRDLPDLRMLYVGGEPLPADVVERWGPALRLENGYGPTECTVTVIRTRVTSPDDIPIGHPVAGHDALILDESLDEVADGEPGELCLTGPGLARGYLGRPEITGARFPLHPQHGRLYRTGDLAVRRYGRLYCLGRRDDQVKIRGHRVELEEIDAHLADVEGISGAAAFLQDVAGSKILAAWLVPSAKSPHPTTEDVRQELTGRLPKHLVPARMGFLDELPRTSGDKLDRRALPPVPLEASCADDADEERSVVEQIVGAAFGHALDSEDAPLDADFFDALGGHSLAAAEVVSKLREDAATETAAVRDLYENPTVRSLAAVLAARGAGPQNSDAAPSSERGSPLAVGMVQALFLALPFAVGAAVAWWALREVVPVALETRVTVIAFLLLPIIGTAARLAWLPVAVTLTVLTKRLLIGRYRPGRHAAWGTFHARHWLTRSVASTIPWGAVADTVLHGAILRRLGARIGRRVHVHRGVDLGAGGWDLLEIGDDATLSRDASLRTVDLRDGHFVLDSVTVGDDATLDIRSSMAPGSRLGRRGFLGPLSSLPTGAESAPGRRVDGVDAVDNGPAPERPGVPAGSSWSPTAHGLWTMAARMLLGLALWLPNAGALLTAASFAGLDARRFEIVFAGRAGVADVALLGAIAIFSLALHVVLEALACRLLCPSSAAAISRWSPGSVRVWFTADLVENAGRWLSGTLLWPRWLRLAGMDIGRDCEISTIIDVLPRMVSIGSGTFFADGIYLGGPVVHRGTVTIARTRLGRATFLGNHAVIPAGANLPDDILIGIATVADDTHITAASSWFGRPAFRLPRREIVAMDRSLTHEPGPLRYTMRALFEGTRAFFPTLPVILLCLWLRWAASGSIAAVALATAATSTLACGGVVVLKWVLLGRVRPGRHGLWSSWCGRWDLLYMAWDRFARPLLSALEQTPFLPVYLRLMGCRIGRRTLLGTGFAQVVDPDMIDIRDDATVNGLFQAHSFEDRVLKIDRVVIREGATVGAGAVLLYGADVGRGARVEPLSVVMKNERLLDGRSYLGCPTRVVT